MPPQQPDRLLDLIDDVLDFCAHGSPARKNHWCRRDVATARCGRKPQPASLATALDAPERPHTALGWSDAAPVDETAATGTDHDRSCYPKKVMEKRAPVTGMLRFPSSIGARLGSHNEIIWIRRSFRLEIMAGSSRFCAWRRGGRNGARGGRRNGVYADRIAGRPFAADRAAAIGARPWKSDRDLCLQRHRSGSRCFVFARAAPSASISATTPMSTTSCTGTVCTCPRRPMARWRKGRRWWRAAARSATRSSQSLPARGGITATTWPGRI